MSKADRGTGKRLPEVVCNASSSTQQVRITQVDLHKKSLRLRLEAYYSLIAPETLADQAEWRSKFDQIYQKYGGSYDGERKLALKLAKKYGSAVRLLLAEPKSDTAVGSASQANDQSRDTEDHEEDWYNLRRSEFKSGDLNFLSVTFDPQAVLTASEAEVLKVNPWVSDCALIDTVGQFASLLPEGDPLRRDPVARKRPLSGDASMAKKKQSQSHPFESIANSFETGPFSVLRRFHRQRVRVVTRYVNAIRGTLTGTLLAFDKHMNMILRDVDEVYSPRPCDRNCRSNVETELDRRRKLSGESEPETNTGGWSVRQRKMKQTMIRGDIVVAVYKACEERPLSKSNYRRSKAKMATIKTKGAPKQTDS